MVIQVLRHMLRPAVVMIALSAVALQVGGCVAPSASVAVVTDRDLPGYLLDVVATLPVEDSFRFVDGPSTDVAAVAGAVVATRAGRLDQARQTLDPLGYDVITLADAHGSYFVVHERTPCHRCWGTYVINRGSATRDVVVEIPHPLFDQHTPEFGIEAFQRTSAAVLLMAGAHRYANGRPVNGVDPASDMARNDHSVFQAVHEKLTTARTDVLQYHGFAGREDYPDVVLSNGSADPNRELTWVAEQISMRAATAGVYDGTDWKDLGATRNPQGKATRAKGGHFFHMEHKPTIRQRPDRRAAMIDAVCAALFTGC